MTLNLQEVARAMQRRGAMPGLSKLPAGAWTRGHRIAGDVYFALRGPNHDGHNFVRAAAEKGAAAVVVERAVRQSKANWW